MKKYLLCCILCLMTAVCFAGCSKADDVETDEEIRIPNEEDAEALGEEAELYKAVEAENLEEKGELVTSEDGLFQVLVPSGWELSKNKIDESMLFEMQGTTEDQYVGILALNKAEYGTLEASAYMEAYAQNAREQYEHAVVGKVTTVDMAGHSEDEDGQSTGLSDPVQEESEPSAYTIKITGTINDISYINLVYVVDYESEIVVFTASTYAENEALAAEDLLTVVNSFEKTDA